MACEHKRIRCTNGVFFCLDCGARIDPPVTTEAAEKATEAATEHPEKPKRRTRKGATK